MGRVLSYNMVGVFYTATGIVICIFVETDPMSEFTELGFYVFWDAWGATAHTKRIGLTRHCIPPLRDLKPPQNEHATTPHNLLQT